MSDYVLLTDVTADLTAEILDKINVKAIPMPFFVDGVEYKHYPDFREYDWGKFYEVLRTKAKVSTAQINVETYMEYFEAELKEGRDVVYLCFSSGLSGTIQSAHIAIETLKEKYPGRTVYCVDSLCASGGFGMFVYYAAKQREITKDVKDFVEWCEKAKLHLCHWFTVEDLFFLHAGGRVSKTVAIAGSLLKIMPVMHVDNEGHLILMDKVRGRHAALEALGEKMLATAIEPEKQEIFICHGDDIKSAEFLKEYILSKTEVKDVIIQPLGPVIGSHSGPGTIALFFWGKER